MFDPPPMIRTKIMLALIALGVIGFVLSWTGYSPFLVGGLYALVVLGLDLYDLRRKRSP